MRCLSTITTLLAIVLISHGQQRGAGTVARYLPGPINPYRGFPSGAVTAFGHTMPGMPLGWSTPPGTKFFSPGFGFRRALPLWQTGGFLAPDAQLMLDWNPWLAPAFNSHGLYDTPSYPFWPDWLEPPAPSSVASVQPSSSEQSSVPMTEETAHDTLENLKPSASEMRAYHGPSSPPDLTDVHPPLVALKNHWAYTVEKYWVTGKTFHFVTTQGDHIQVPTSMVDRIYPIQTRSEISQRNLNLTH